MQGQIKHDVHPWRKANYFMTNILEMNEKLCRRWGQRVFVSHDSIISQKVKKGCLQICVSVKITYASLQRFLSVYSPPVVSNLSDIEEKNWVQLQWIGTEDVNPTK